MLIGFLIFIVVVAVVVAVAAIVDAEGARDKADKTLNQLADYKNATNKRFATLATVENLAQFKADVITGASLAASVIMSEQKDEIEKLKKQLTAVSTPIIVTGRVVDVPNAPKKPAGKVKPVRVK